jgi:hypothetical protein
MTPEEAVSQIEKETKSKPGKEGSNSKEVFKVSFRVQRVFIPIGLQPKGTPLPIGFVARPDDQSNTHFSALSVNDVVRDIERLGIFQPEKYFKNRSIEVTGHITVFPPSEPGAKETYQIMVRSLHNFRVIE